MIDIRQFKNLRLHGGFIIKNIGLTDEPIMDAIGREAIAQTSAIARELRLLIRAGLSEEELSITLYHEILEAASVAIANPPASVMDFNKANFEQAARAAHERWGNASPASLISCCNFMDFEENEFMVDRDKIQFDLIKLANGGRILRLTEPRSGLALEKKLAPADAVVRQKEKLLRAFEAALARVELAAA